MLQMATIKEKIHIERVGFAQTSNICVAAARQTVCYRRRAGTGPGFAQGICTRRPEHGPTLTGPRRRVQPIAGTRRPHRTSANIEHCAPVCPMGPGSNQADFSTTGDGPGPAAVCRFSCCWPAGTWRRHLAGPGGPLPTRPGPWLRWSGARRSGCDSEHSQWTRRPPAGTALCGHPRVAVTTAADPTRAGASAPASEPRSSPGPGRAPIRIPYAIRHHTRRDCGVPVQVASDAGGGSSSSST